MYKYEKYTLCILIEIIIKMPIQIYTFTVVNFKITRIQNKYSI